MVYTAEQAFEFLKNNPNISVSEKVDQRLENDAAEKPKKPCISVSSPTRSAASRAGMAGWAGEGGGRFGERREYEAPTLPSTPRQHGMARHHKRQERDSSSTAWLATTHASRETARHHTRQARNGMPPQKPGKTPHRIPTEQARHHKRQPRNKPRQPRTIVNPRIPTHPATFL